MTCVSRTAPHCCDRLSAVGGAAVVTGDPGRGAEAPCHPLTRRVSRFSPETYHVPRPDGCPAPRAHFPHFKFLFGSVPFSAFPVLGNHHL